jgi:glycosyltransferase involved in cell wall biosynthesis
MLLECLDSLKNQSLNNFEIILVDNGGNDTISEKLYYYNVLHIKMKQNTPVPRARNIGSYFSKSPIIAFIDDDAICEAKLIENAMKTFEDYPDTMAIRGKIIPISNSIYNKLQSHYSLGNKPLYGHFHECCSFFRKNAWIELEDYHNTVYNEKLINYQEGMITIYGLVKNYSIKSLLYQPSMVVYHNYATSFKQYLFKKKCGLKAIDNYRKNFPEIINFMEQDYYPARIQPSVINGNFIDGILIRIIKIALKIYFQFCKMYQ